MRERRVAVGGKLSTLLILPCFLAGLTAAEASPRWLEVGVETATDFPIDVGGSVWVELPHRVRLRTSFGYLPRPYVDAVNAALVAANAYSDNTASLIAAALESSFVWRLHAGWRPFPRRGAYFELGYGLVALGGGLTTGQALSAVTGQPPLNVGPGGYDLSSILHMVDVDLGWQWIVSRGLTFRVGVGCALTVWSHTEVTPRSAANSAAEARFTEAAATYLDDTYRRYVFTPTISFAIGWRFLPWLERGWGQPTSRGARPTSIPVNSSR